VHGQAYRAVDDNTVHAGAGQGNGRDVVFQKGEVADAGCLGIAAGEREHVVRHVQSDGELRRADALSGQEDVPAAPGAEMQHHLVRLEDGHCSRVAAAQRGHRGGMARQRLVRV